jgi:hypothetical protein
LAGEVGNLLALGSKYICLFRITFDFIGCPQRDSITFVFFFFFRSLVYWKSISGLYD